jgi:hypothetical protein
MSADTVGSLVRSFEIAAGKSTTHISAAVSIRIGLSACERKDGAATNNEPAQVGSPPLGNVVQNWDARVRR